MLTSMSPFIRRQIRQKFGMKIFLLTVEVWPIDLVEQEVELRSLGLHQAIQLDTHYEIFKKFPFLYFFALFYWTMPKTMFR